MTVREIYRLRHQKAVGFNRARSRVIEQLVAQRGLNVLISCNLCGHSVTNWLALQQMKHR